MGYRCLGFFLSTWNLKQVFFYVGLSFPIYNKKERNNIIFQMNFSCIQNSAIFFGEPYSLWGGGDEILGEMFFSDYGY